MLAPKVAAVQAMLLNAWGWSPETQTVEVLAQDAFNAITKWLAENGPFRRVGDAGGERVS